MTLKVGPGFSIFLVLQYELNFISATFRTGKILKTAQNFEAHNSSTPNIEFMFVVDLFMFDVGVMKSKPVL